MRSCSGFAEQADTFDGRTTEEIADAVQRPVEVVQKELEYLAEGDLITRRDGKWCTRKQHESDDGPTPMGKAFNLIAGRSMKRHNGFCITLGRL
ncbi:MAG: hypothetical protein U0798_15325 [Gemmataceae bacterium]